MNNKNYFQEINYAQDLRNCESDKTPTVFINDEEIELPTKWEVCNVCNGEGKHVNPSIDCGGLTHEDFQEDPDFYHDYMSGTYDQTCNKCNGRTTVREVNWDALSNEMRTAYEQQLQEEAEDRAMHLAELRMGA